MALSDVALCARALVMIGTAPISSFEEDSAEAEIARMLYPVIRDGMLAPLTESSSRAEYLFKRSEDQFRSARLADAQQSTPHAIEDFSLIAARG